MDGGAKPGGLTEDLRDVPLPATSLIAEQAEQRRWRLRPEQAGSRAFDRLLINEFLPEEELRAQQSRVLSALVQFACVQVPYYRRLFQHHGLTADDVQRPEDLPRLPFLSKADLREQGTALRPLVYPRGHRPVMRTSSSGTTGHPARVVHSLLHAKFWHLLKQRELRWFRFDPMRKLGHIRPPDELPKIDGKRSIEIGETVHRAAWPLVGQHFRTGPFVGYCDTDSVDNQIEWLNKHRPDYVTAAPGRLEHLAFALQGRPRPDYLRGFHAISASLTPGIRRYIEGAFHVRVDENYGLNEIGLVASRCPEAGRYHVHIEHCIVEIVDEQMQPCAPGETGRILVTKLNNLAMPLIRYDTDDLAQVLEDPCPCGRTLPSFGQIVGRYRRHMFLPAGTMDYFYAIRDAVQNVPASVGENLRQFQVHQYRDGPFELRLAGVAPLPTEFREHIRAAWRQSVGENGPELRIIELDEIPPGPGRKYQDFTSDFFPGPDSDTTSDAGGPTSDRP